MADPAEPPPTSDPESDPASDLPARPVLRPGLHVLRRDDRHVQVGLGPGCVVLRDSPETRRVLEALRSGQRPRLDSQTARVVVAALTGRGLVVDAAFLHGDVRGAGPVAPSVLATYAAVGADARRRLAARAGARVLVEATEEASAPAGSLRTLLGSYGIAPAERRGEADLVVLATAGEVRREEVDDLVRGGRPHLVLSAGAAACRVGPLVVPGVTACLRCVDARLAEEDPRWPVLLRQCGAATRSPGPAPVDPALQAAGVALAARDVVGFVDGDQAASWSATLTVAAGAAPQRRAWPRHPHCGCAWDELLAG